MDTAAPDEARLRDVVGSLFRSERFRCQAYFRGQVCDRFAIDTSGSGRVSFHAVGGGHCWLHMTSLQQPRRLEAGDVLILPLDAQHVLEASPAAVPRFGTNKADRVIRIDPGQAGTALVCGFLDVSEPVRDLVLASLPDHIIAGRRDRDGDQIGRLVDALFAEAMGEGPAADAMVERLADALLLKVFEVGIARLERPVGFIAALADPNIGRALTVAVREPHRVWTVETLADVAHMSRSAFAARFSELVGRGPMEVITDWRMQLAWRLLEQEHLGVARVSERVGYQAEAAFRKAFKRHFGVGPGELRRR